MGWQKRGDLKMNGERTGGCKGKKRSSIKKDLPLSFAVSASSRSADGRKSCRGKEEEEEEKWEKPAYKNGRVIFSVERIMGDLYHRLKEPLVIISNIIFWLNRLFFVHHNFSNEEIFFQYFEHFFADKQINVNSQEKLETRRNAQKMSQTWNLKRSLLIQKMSKKYKIRNSANVSIIQILYYYWLIIYIFKFKFIFENFFDTWVPTFVQQFINMIRKTLKNKRLTILWHCLLNSKVQNQRLESAMGSF